MKSHLLKRREDIVNHLKRKKERKKETKNKNENIISFLEYNLFFSLS